MSGSKDFRYSHLAKVVAGLAGVSVPAGERRYAQPRSVPRHGAPVDQRATALTASDLKKGVTALATIGSTAPFVGLLGTVIGVINAFVGIGATGTGSIGAVSVGIAEALIETALGLFVAIPAVVLQLPEQPPRYFNVEMDNSSSEFVDYFIKKTAAA